MTQPKVTDEDMHAALQILKIKGSPTMHQAMADPLHARILKIVATTISHRNHQAHQARQLVRRVKLDPKGQVAAWCSQVVTVTDYETEHDLFPGAGHGC